ncbi:uncharacterized protein LOC103858131 [Brassica rapa]|uniref:uncharacterized protein LOC103858131 n=1 Tax=Brassica campestris TaxID=3711 RepID=UPI0004F16B87|nr:uncharacterized protein LOC103858131 [Brassica rapa]
MNRKLTPAEKGSEAPRRARVRVQEPDLLQKHSLTLIGKVTNPSVQKVPSLIPFFTNHWKTNEIRTVGSDLGQGLFQFQFDSESDLLAVLENRPYHFAKWMVILQRWEPTVSPSFPSLIPFWIKVEGIPAHLWTEETIRSIGEDIGRFECSDIISTLSVRMRVHVNGRLPLIKSSVIEYPNGDEVRVSLVYEKLEKHCSHCYRLDHELKDCLAAKHQKKKANALALAVQHKEEQSSYGNSQSVRGTPLRIPHDSLPPQALEEALGEGREVMVQCTSCEEPWESAGERLRQAAEQGQLEQRAAQMVRATLSKHQLNATMTVPSNSHNGSKQQQRNIKSRTNRSKADSNAVPPQAGVSLTRELLATLASFLPATSQPESRQTVPQYNGGEALPQSWHRDSQTVHDASNQLYAAGQLPPPPPPRYYLSGGNMQYQGQGQSFSMPQNNKAGGSSNHAVFQRMTQQYQSEASVQNQSYGPASSYEQANYHGVATSQVHNPSQFQAAMQPPPMLSGAGQGTRDVEKEERYQKTLQFAASLLHQINQP